MNFDTFVQLLHERLPVGLKMENPGGGASTVTSCSDTRVRYKRGKRPYRMNLRDLYDVYQHFGGSAVTTNDLKDYAPGVFDQSNNGHNCHRTFFFMVLRHMGIVDAIWGSGQAGSPFGATIPALQVGG